MILHSSLRSTLMFMYSFCFSYQSFCGSWVIGDFLVQCNGPTEFEQHFCLHPKTTLSFFYKNIVFPAQAEYSYFSANVRLKIFL